MVRRLLAPCLYGLLVLPFTATLLLPALLSAEEDPADGSPSSAQAGAHDEARLRDALRSHATKRREEAIREVIAHGAVSIPRARVWTRSEDVRLREAGWRVLGAMGRAEDLRAALAGLGDSQPTAALAAAHAAVALGAALPPEPGVWLPHRALPARGMRPLAAALAQAIEHGPRDGVPQVVLRLGEGVLPSLTYLAATRRVDLGVRAGALRCLAAIGGDDARRAIAARAEEFQEDRKHPLWRTWWQAILAVGRGRGLAKAHDLIVGLAEAGENPMRGPLRKLDWRNRLYYVRFVAHCPPAEGLDAVRAYLEGEIERAADDRRRGFFPTLAAPIIRAYLVVGEPTDTMLRAAVLCAQGRQRRGALRRAEELGEVLALLAPYRDRKGVQAGLEELLEVDPLPRTVRAWATYLQGKSSKSEIVGLADGLLDQEHGATTLAERRLGARLLAELGVPALERIRSTRTDLDAYLRMIGLAWSDAGEETGVIAASEREHAFRHGLEDPDDGVFLVAAERVKGPVGAGNRDRLLQLGVGGPVSLRGRVWRLIERLLAREPGAPTRAFSGPGAFAALDQRLRAAAQARSLWGL